MPHRTYAAQRLAALLTPVSYLQRAPYSGTTRALTIRTADEVELAATLLPRGQSSLLIFCHGFASNQQSVANVWLAEALAGPWDVLTFDWRGYGQSGGVATFGGAEALDLAAVLEYTRTLGYRRVGLIGESMGGLIVLATLGAALEDVLAFPDRVAVIGAPADYDLTAGPRPQLLRYVKEQAWVRPLTPLLGFRLGQPDPVRPLDVLNQLALPLLVVHGDKDRTVPVENAYHIKEEVPAATLRIYERVDHAVEAMRLQAPQQLLEDLRNHFAAM